MKETDLRRAFASITPDESLIRATIEKVQAQQYANAAQKAAALAQPTRKLSAYTLAYRLAGAACALLLVLGMGISLSKDVTQPALTPDAAAYSRTQFNDVSPAAYAADEAIEEQADTPTAPAYGELAREQIIARAATLPSDWLVVDAELCGCYVLPTQEDSAPVCTLSLDKVSVVEHADRESAQALAQTVGESASIPAVQMTFANAEEQNALLNLFGSRLCLILRVDGETLCVDSAYLLANE